MQAVKYVHPTSNWIPKQQIIVELSSIINSLIFETEIQHHIAFVKENNCLGAGPFASKLNKLKTIGNAMLYAAQIPDISSIQSVCYSNDGAKTWAKQTTPHLEFTQKTDIPYYSNVEITSNDNTFLFAAGANAQFKTIYGETPQRVQTIIIFGFF